MGSVILNSDIMIVHQNIRSLRRNFGVLVANVNVYKNKPSFIFLSEIWVNSYELSLYNLGGYTLFGACNDSYRSGGVCVYFDTHLCCSLLAFNLTSCDIVRVDWSLANDIYVILCIYRLHDTPVSVFLQEISSFISNIKSKNLFIVGDINIDILESSSHCIDYMFLMSSFGLESLVNIPTRVTTSSSTCIDHFFARLRTNDLSCLLPSAIDLKITDHHFIEILFKFDIGFTSRRSFYSGQEKRVNMVLLNEFVEQVDWTSVLNLNDSSLALDSFLSIISNILKQCYVYARVNNIRLLQPWISYNLANRIKKRNRFRKKLNKHPNDMNLRAIYDRICRQINVDVRSEKEMYYMNRFSINSGDVKKSWRLVNEILTKKAKTSSIKNILSDSGSLITNEVDISNEFNCYFTSIADKLRAKLVANTLPINHDLPYDYCSKTFFLTPVSNSEIFAIIESLEPKQSLDIEGISNNILKAISKLISPVLAHIFNLSFEQGVVPKRLKYATIIPIFKSGDHSDKGNYRPIALQPVILKVLEKAVKSRVTIFLDLCKTLSVHQHGFRQGMSTESAMLDFLDIIHNGLNNGKICAGLFIDATKAFDMVDHKLLLSILFDVGFRGVSNRWFASYLDDRAVRVRVNDTFSDFRAVNVGVPQGSVLGPLLFLVYTNSIFKLHLNGHSTGFADDLALAYASESANDVISMVNSDLRILHKWFDKHFLILSEKTKFMWFKIFGTATAPSLSQVKYHNASMCTSVSCHSDCFDIELVNSFKYLGIHLDTNLNWKTHISKVISYMASASRIFYLLRDLCPVSVLKMTFYALVMSKLEYGLSLWGCCYPTTLKPVYVQQKMILRIILRKNRLESSWPLFKSTGILPLQHLYVYKVLRVFFKRSGLHVLRGDARYNFRVNHRLLYIVPRFNNEHFRRYIAVTAPTFFNALPEHIRRHVCSKKFLLHVRDWLLDTPDVSHLLYVII